MDVKKRIESEYPFLYETHMHTSQGSACGKATGKEMAEGAKKYGYTGIIVTEHNWGGNTAVPKGLPWKEWVDRFTKGYEEAFAYGQEHDLDVFWGYEAGYDGTEFLIYGVTPEWMRAHPELKNAGVEEQYRLVKAEQGLVIHAHPFREEWYIPKIRLFPNCVDGAEVINATHSNSRSYSHNDPDFNTRAIEYANQYQMIMTAGSDMHWPDTFGGGMRFKRRLTSVQDFCNAVMRQEPYVLTDGESFWTSKGVLIRE